MVWLMSGAVVVPSAFMDALSGPGGAALVRLVGLGGYDEDGPIGHLNEFV